ncbi:helix-turn-helix domain-containing protein [Sphingomonas sp. Leaf33]|uniref:helix-turn-helix domain-containing protein n=1 Tax=Sphingomonas sp. Leaf33 TaxID=1736215 RepID=UPI0009EBEA41|nr:helix-turn-helix transcriptional regulator [Sphingomonas sp. Leaf33]
MISVDQCRAGRALLDWSAQALADKAGIGVATVRRFEAGSAIAAGSLAAISDAMMSAGVTFIAAGESSPDGGEGARLTSPSSGG